MYLDYCTHGLFITKTHSFISCIHTIIIYTYIDWQYKVMAQFPFSLPLLVSLSVPLSIPFYLLGIPPFAWCDPVHLGPRLLINWTPPPHSLPIPNSQHPRSIVRPTKTTSRLRLHRVRNTSSSRLKQWEWTPRSYVIHSFYIPWQSINICPCIHVQPLPSEGLHCAPGASVQGFRPRGSAGGTQHCLSHSSVS